MVAAIRNFIFRFLGMFWLTGPVFDKELRISSRRKRNYVLRFTYISLLLSILLFIWIQIVEYQSSNVVQISRMAQAGKFITAYILWFQFIAAQIIAIVMLSNAISDEIYNKTLGMLMTTPITSLQIVMGKLLSKLLQLLLLVAISMPLLGIVRLLGGVPWRFVTSSLWITFTTVLFVSSLSLFFSIFYRRAYRVIIVTFITLFGLFALVPFIIITIIHMSGAYRTWDERVIIFILYQPNPYLTFFLNTITMVEPRSGGAFYSSIYINCIFISFWSLLLLLISILKVRKVALRQATGQLSSKRRKVLANESGAMKKYSNSSCVSVVGPPVIWKEIILPFRKGSKTCKIIAAALMLSVICFSYWYNIRYKTINHDYTHFMYITIYLILGLFSTLVLSSTNITSEKESRSWPLLLSSTLKDNQIVLGKYIGALSRCFPIWLLLLGHVLYFCIDKMIHPAGLFLAVIFVIWIVLFLCASGVYFSSRFKRTTTAVIMNLIFAAFIWGLIPLFLGIVCSIYENPDLIISYMSYNPFVQIVTVIRGTFVRNISRSSFYSLSFNILGHHALSLNEMLSLFTTSFIIYLTIASLFLWRAKKCLRRKIF